jgi:NitT/TauT family transport system permease protein
MTASRGVSVLSTVAILGVLLLAWQIGSALGAIRPSVLPAPQAIGLALAAEVRQPAFWHDLGRTLEELVLSFVGGTMLGGLAGWAFWRQPLVGRMFEPYLVAFYAVPLVVFYPVAIVVIGLNEWPIVILAALMTAIPMALNTWNGLSRIRPVYLVLGRSLRASRFQTAVRLVLPAAAPLLFAGVKLGAVYSLIGVIAMEFLTASSGLGFEIRYQFEDFNDDRMYAYMAVVFLLSVLLTAAVELAESRVLSRG